VERDPKTEKALGESVDDVIRKSFGLPKNED